MSVTYHRILRQIAIRTNSLVGVDAATLEASYVTSPLTAAQFDGADFTFAAHKDALQSAEEILARAIASKKDDPNRNYLKSQTASLASGTEIGKTDGAGAPIIGVYGSVRGTADGEVCTEKPIALIRRLNAETWRTYLLAYFAIEGTRIYHTKSGGVKIDVCIYDRAAQATAIDNNSAILLSDDLEPAYVAGALMMLTRDDAFAGQAGIYAGYFKEQVAA
jgi:hypothetical protein